MTAQKHAVDDCSAQELYPFYTLWAIAFWHIFDYTHYVDSLLSDPTDLYERREVVELSGVPRIKPLVKGHYAGMTNIMGFQMRRSVRPPVT